MELINGNITPVLEPNNESNPSVDFVVTCSTLSVSLSFRDLNLGLARSFARGP